MKKVTLIVSLILLIPITGGAWEWHKPSSSYHIEYSTCAICERRIYKKIRHNDYSDGVLLDNMNRYVYVPNLFDGEEARTLDYPQAIKVCRECYKKYSGLLRDGIKKYLTKQINAFRIVNTEEREKNERFNTERDERKRLRKILELEIELKKLRGEPVEEPIFWKDDLPIYRKDIEEGKLWKSGVSKHIKELKFR